MTRPEMLIAAAQAALRVGREIQLKKVCVGERENQDGCLSNCLTVCVRVRVCVCCSWRFPLHHCALVNKLKAKRIQHRCQWETSLSALRIKSQAMANNYSVLEDTQTLTHTHTYIASIYAVARQLK